MKIYSFSAIVLLLLLLVACTNNRTIEIEAGVSKSLAEYRATSISDITYHLRFSIPEKLDECIPAEVKINFNLKNTENPIVLDFRETRVNIKKIWIDDKPTSYDIVYDHIVISTCQLNKGQHTIEIDFFAGKRSLNLNSDFLYTLFVPDRACTAFPCFDQPDMKAIFNLQLEIPSKWQAVSSGSITNEEKLNWRKILTFTPSSRLSTYLFSFAAGRFEIATQMHNGRAYRILHRQTDSLALRRNLPEIFASLFQSADWLEEYTAMPYPFQKYDLICIPSFQYSGMENAGAILFRESNMLLDKLPSRKQQLERARLIAHETAHVWFGNLVTMKWFDEVWLKEMLAIYVADKIVQPMFPDMDHNLQFIVEHYPKAYETDRSKGTTAITQELENLNLTSTIYGDIVYHKAPIVMEKLEEITGKQLLKKGLQEYLKKFAFSNASWNDLIQILDKQTPYDLSEWSKNWIYEAGMPSYEISRTKKHTLYQIDPENKDRIWPQNITISRGRDEMKIHTALRYQTLGFDNNGNDTFLINSTGKGYGFFKMSKDELSISILELQKLKDPVQRVSVWMNLYENMLNKQLTSIRFYEILVQNLATEKNDLVVGLLLSYLNTTFSILLPDFYKVQNQTILETFLWNQLLSCPREQKRDYFKNYLLLFRTSNAAEKINELWNETLKIDGLPFSEDDFMNMSFELAVRTHSNTDILQQKELNRLQNSQKKEQLKFIWPALSNDEKTRNAFFDALKKSIKRNHTQWIETAFVYFNRPSPYCNTLKFLRPSLELLQTIQTTDDVFFLQRWLDALLKEQTTPEAKKIVIDFLDNNPNYPAKLRSKISQTADLLFRSSDIKAFNRELLLGTKIQ